jgi:hypothetical protein
MWVDAYSWIPNACAPASCQHTKRWQPIVAAAEAEVHALRAPHEPCQVALRVTSCSIAHPVSWQLLRNATSGRTPTQTSHCDYTTAARLHPRAHAAGGAHSCSCSQGNSWICWQPYWQARGHCTLPGVAAAMLSHMHMLAQPLPRTPCCGVAGVQWHSSPGNSNFLRLCCCLLHCWQAQHPASDAPRPLATCADTTNAGTYLALSAACAHKCVNAFLLPRTCCQQAAQQNPPEHPTYTTQVTASMEEVYQRQHNPAARLTAWHCLCFLLTTVSQLAAKACHPDAM